MVAVDHDGHFSVFVGMLEKIEDAAFFALEKFSEATKYYHVTTDLTKIPDISTLTNEQLPSLFTMNDARQLIHITYGLILTQKNEDGSYTFRDKLYNMWRVHTEEYKKALYNHISHHLDLLGTKCN